MSATILTLVRHGETAANTELVWHGSTDTPLTERGHAQAARVGAFLGSRHSDISSIYASPLERARDTADPIARRLGLDVRIEPDLREFDLGSWEGRSYKSLFEEERLWHHMKRDPHFAPHGGESPLAATERLLGALQRIAAAHPGQRVIIVSHGGALSMALGKLLDDDYSEWRRMMENCAVSDLVLEPAPALLTFNETSHLADL